MAFEICLDRFAKYEYALVCKNLPKSLVSGLSLEKHDPISLEEAAIQHSEYLSYLRASGLKLIEIEAQEIYPDCVFVEDTTVAVDNKIFITNPGAESRRGEILAVAAKFKEHAEGLGLDIFEIQNKDEAFIDGGDVCFTGRELLVGLSKRTNQKGADELAEAFKGIPVITCNVYEGLHLKSSMSMLSCDVILIGSSAAANSVHKQIVEKSLFSEYYKFVEVDEDESGSANVLLFNDRLVYPKSFERLYDQIIEFKSGVSETKALVNDEFKKIDGCLTCRCVFFNSRK